MSFSYKPLFKLLIDKGMKKTDLKDLLGISPSLLAKFSKDQYVSMRVLDDLCNLFDCELKDIVEYKKDSQ